MDERNVAAEYEIRNLQREVESLSRQNTEMQLRINKGVRALDRLLAVPTSTDQWAMKTIRQIQADLRGKK